MVSRNTWYTQCSGDDSSPCNVAIITRADKTEPPPDMSFRGSAASRGIFLSGKFYLVLVLSPTWWIPPLRFAAVGMTDVSPFVRCKFECTTMPALPPGPDGGRLPPLQCVVHCNTVWSIRLNNYNVPGGRLPPLQYICSESPCFQRIFHRFTSVKYQKRCTLP